MWIPEECGLYVLTRINSWCGNRKNVVSTFWLRRYDIVSTISVQQFESQGECVCSQGEEPKMGCTWQQRPTCKRVPSYLKIPESRLEFLTTGLQYSKINLHYTDRKRYNEFCLTVKLLQHWIYCVTPTTLLHTYYTRLQIANCKLQCPQSHDAS